MVNIIGYEEVTVGSDIIQQPIYDEPIIVIGAADNQVVMSLREYELEQEAREAEILDKPTNQGV